MAEQGSYIFKTLPPIGGVSHRAQNHWWMCVSVWSWGWGQSSKLWTKPDGYV